MFARCMHEEIGELSGYFCQFAFFPSRCLKAKAAFSFFFPLLLLFPLLPTRPTLKNAARCLCPSPSSPSHLSSPSRPGWSPQRPPAPVCSGARPWASPESGPREPRAAEVATATFAAGGASLAISAWWLLASGGVWTLNSGKEKLQRKEAVRGAVNGGSGFSSAAASSASPSAAPTRARREVRVGPLEGSSVRL